MKDSTMAPGSAQMPQDASEGVKSYKGAATAARPISEDASHFYTLEGSPLYRVPKKDGSGMRPFTLTDARKMTPLPVPSVTTILKLLNKPALNDWLIEQSVLACLTTPRLHSEDIDAFVKRVLHTDRVQDQEAQKARDLGTDIHAGMEALMRGERVSDELMPWIDPAYQAIQGDCIWQSEAILVGDGYAGRCDLIQDYPDRIVLWDYKTTKNLPKSAWMEHRLQLSAYAMAYKDLRPKITKNLYISTTDCGKFVIAEHEEYMETYNLGFRPLVTHWRWANNYGNL